MRRRTTHLCLAAVASASALALAACGGSDSNSSSGGSYGGGYGSSAATTTTTSATPAASKATTVTLTADPSGKLAFDQTKLTAKAGTVTVQMKNPSSSGLPHGIAVEGNGVDQDGKTVQPGGTSTDTLKLKPGTYTFYCPVPGHKAGGMKGTLVVT